MRTPHYSGHFNLAQRCPDQRNVPLYCIIYATLQVYNYIYCILLEVYMGFSEYVVERLLLGIYN